MKKYYSSAASVAVILFALLAARGAVALADVPVGHIPGQLNAPVQPPYDLRIARATGPAGTTVGTELVGQWGGPSYAVAISGSKAYVGVGPRLFVLDISNP
ncbi:MAG: hypothetical protein NTU88_12480, partial [Armatimonadetes bacterium]|nr:hypothetical protein [Armatimonadota bacterium]